MARLTAWTLKTIRYTDPCYTIGTRSMNADNSQENERLRKAHHLLMNSLERLHSDLPRLEAADLRTRVRELQQILQEHFRLEEGENYFEIVRNRRPGLEHQLEGLFREHADLKNTLEEIHSQLSTSTVDLIALRRQIEKWARSVHAHETNENELLQDAFLSDTGAGD